MTIKTRKSPRSQLISFAVSTVYVDALEESREEVTQTQPKHLPRLYLWHFEASLFARSRKREIVYRLKHKLIVPSRFPS